MNRLNAQEIERRLAEQPAPPPPAELLERIQSEIPDASEIWPEEPPATTPGPRRWLIAASLIVAVGGGLLGYRTLQETDVDELARKSRIERPAPAEEPIAAPDRVLRDDLAVPDGPVELAEPQAESEPLPAPKPARKVPIPDPTPDEAEGSAAVVVRDSQGNPLPGASIEMSGSGGKRVEVTGASGEARFDELDPGSWELKATLDGFSSVEYPEVEVRSERQTKLEVALPSVAEEVITVTSQSPLLDRRTSSGAAVTLERLVRERPAPQPAPATAPPSTGGTAEPNDQPYGDVFYREYGVNPFIDTEDDRFSTFGLDVDTGSYTIVRRYLDDGNLPPREAVRIEEFLNYFDYRDAPPERGDFALHAELAPAPFATGERYQVLRFGIRGRVVDPADRKPATLIFVVDVSGSMGRENRLGLVIRSLTLLLDQLRPADRVGLVVYGSRGQVLLEPSGDHETIRAAIERLRPGGSTNAEEGLLLAYEQASRAFRAEAINRIVLCSDGVANVGRTGPDSILERVRREAERGIELTTVGFGMGNYNDVLMEQLADQGNGRYAYVDDLTEARRIFVENLTGTLQTIASDAKVQVEFNPEVVSRYRLLGYENRDIADERFRDDTVDAGEIGAGHSVTALYEIKLSDKRPRRAPLATLHLRYRSQETREIVEIERSVRERDGAEHWRGAAPALKLAAVVAEFGEILKGSYWAKDGDLGRLLEAAQELSPEFAGDGDVAELVGLIAKAAKLRPGGE